MAKLLIVSDRSLLGQVSAQVLRESFEEVVEAHHDSALEVFLAEEPTHVFIFEYEERGKKGEKSCQGIQTWNDLKNSAEVGQTMVRCGFSRCDQPDYIQMPFRIEELRERLGIKK